MSGDLDDLAKRTPGFVEAVARILERIERRDGRMPARMTLPASAAVAEALRRVFSPRAVQALGDAQVRLELTTYLRDRGEGAEDALVRALYAVAGREPRDPAGDARAMRLALERALVDLEARARTNVSREFAHAQRAALGSADGGALALRAGEIGVDAATALARDVVRCLDAVCEIVEPIRAQTFAARAMGSSKALGRSGDLFRWVSDALVTHDPRTSVLLDEEGVPPTAVAMRANALEVNGVLFDEAAASVLCFGPLVYVKRGERFDSVARHASLGESSRILVQQLRDTVLERPPARRVTVFENLAPYLDYVDACVARGRADEIVLCSGGQANGAVVGLLRRIAAHAIPTRHAGDLDRSGVLILRSLAKRSGAKIVPVHMDAVTHRRFVSRGQPISDAERGRLAALVHEDDANAASHDLLREVLVTATWIEQEAFADDVLEELWTG